MHRRAVPLLLVLVFALGLAPVAPAGKFEDSVRSQWRGAWVVLQVEAYSTCSGAYYNNDVSGQFVTSRGGRRFAVGELGKVDRVQVKKKKAELMISIPSRVLIPYQDGPFTLYSERYCKLELEVAVPRDRIKAKDLGAVERALMQVATRYRTAEEARSSQLWNGREGDEYPGDYQLTLARHARWHAEQTNLAIDERIEIALEEAEHLTFLIDEDSHYLSGFAAGAQEMQHWRERDCGRLLSGQFVSVRHAAPEEWKEVQNWCDGYFDGQQLAYSIALVRRLGMCYVDVPPEPVASDFPSVSSRSGDDGETVSRSSPGSG